MRADLVPHRIGNPQCSALVAQVVAYTQYPTQDELCKERELRSSERAGRIKAEKAFRAAVGSMPTPDGAVVGTPVHASRFEFYSSSFLQRAHVRTRIFLRA